MYIIHVTYVINNIISQLKLSHEHQGFVFQPDTTKAIDMLINHSGGKVSKALRKAIEQGEIEQSIEQADDSTDNKQLIEESKIAGENKNGEDLV